MKLLAVSKLSVESVVKTKGTRIGFFHPYFTTCGGGERVLWTTLLTLFKINPDLVFLIYSSNENKGKDLSKILTQAANTFNLPELENPEVLRNTRVVHLRTSILLRASIYPRLTLLFQSIGSMVVSIDGLIKADCDIFFDTTGFAFTFPCIKLFWLLSSSFLSYSSKHIVAYIHYPTISLDMLEFVANQNSGFNNSAIVAKSRLLTKLKTLYYRIFALGYGLVGKFCDCAFVNSAWTKKHIDSIWHRKCTIIFPPCNVSSIDSVNSIEERENLIVSLGQFRPEKNHLLQLHSYASLYEICSREALTPPKFILIGGCRNEDDYARVEEYKAISKKLKISEHVTFEVNCPYERLNSLLQQGSIGLHTMINEHFGIAPVEMQSKGLIVIAHESGGPKADIINHGETGFLASTPEQIATAIYEVLRMKTSYLSRLRRNSVNSAQRFSSSAFMDSLTTALIRIG